MPSSDAGTEDRTIRYQCLDGNLQSEVWDPKHRYPGKKSHDRVHERLLLDASRFESLLNRGGDLFVLRSIKDWLVNHIETEDKVLGEFLNKHVRRPD